MSTDEGCTLRDRRNTQQGALGRWVWENTGACGFSLFGLQDPSAPGLSSLAGHLPSPVQLDSDSAAQTLNLRFAFTMLGSPCHLRSSDFQRADSEHFAAC